MNDEQIARGLGWFSIGLGLAELIAPRRIGETVGVRGHEELIRSYGVREVLSGIGILTSKEPPATWMWSRVAGDALDLGSLAVAFHSENTAPRDRRRVCAALTMVAGVTALDMMMASRLSAAGRRSEEMHDGNAPLASRRRRGGARFTRKVITINKPREEIFSFWRNFENLPRFMNHLKSVTVLADGRSHWVAKGPLNRDVEWDAEVTAETPNESISWQSLPGATVENAGTVHFDRATGGRGTVVRVDLQYRIPGGAIGNAVAKLFGESPEKQIPVDLIRLKQLLETGEIARTEGQPAGREHSTSRKFDDFVRT
jgi:uncharacterized membrane protein